MGNDKELFGKIIDYAEFRKGYMNLPENVNQMNLFNIVLKSFNELIDPKKMIKFNDGVTQAYYLIGNYKNSVNYEELTLAGVNTNSTRFYKFTNWLSIAVNNGPFNLNFFPQKYPKGFSGLFDKFLFNLSRKSMSHLGYDEISDFFPLWFAKNEYEFEIRISYPKDEVNVFKIRSNPDQYTSLYALGNELFEYYCDLLKDFKLE